jgi:phosphate transport system substrate-binding protein
MNFVKKFVPFLVMGLVLTGCAAQEEEVVEDSFGTETINVYTRDTTSGTRDGFFNGIGYGDAAADDSLLVEGFITADNTGIMTAMTTDVAGIGYVSLSSVNNTIKALNFEGVEATEENVMNDTYGLKRPFMMITRDLNDYASDTERDLSLAFIAYTQSNEGADVIANKGATPVAATGLWAEIVKDHPVCSLDNSATTLKFGGSDSVQKIAEALSEAFSPACGNVVTENDHTGSGDAFKRTQGEQKDETVYKHVAYASRFFKDTEAAVEGTTTQLAWDAIVPIVHLDNPLSDVTAAQLVSIYKGEYTTWAEVLGE